MTTIVVASTKGGVGKTTTATALAYALAQLEQTLLVDLDPQGQCSLHFGLPVRSGVYHWLSGDLPVGDCLCHARPDTLLLMPGDSMTKALYGRYQGADGSNQIAGRLKALAVEYLVVDTAAGGLLQEAALLAADQVVIPFRPEAPSIDGLYASLAIVQQLAPAAKVTLLPTDYDLRLREHRNNLIELRLDLERRSSYAGGPLVDYGLEEVYAIRHRIAVAEAAAYGCTIWEYTSGSGMADVRVGYAYLATRVLKLAGRTETENRILEAMAHGKDK